MVLVFALLIDEKPDSEGHMSHLNITKAERQKLIDNIDGSFGESLEKDNKSWVVSSAALLMRYLMKDYKCRDEWRMLAIYSCSLTDSDRRKICAKEIDK